MSGDRPESLILSVEGDRAVDETEMENVRAAAVRYLSGHDQVLVVPDGWRLVPAWETRGGDVQGPIVTRSQSNEGCAWIATALAALALIVATATLLWR